MWLFFALTTTFMWGLAELFYKKGARPDEKYAHLKISVTVGVVMGAHAIFTLLTKNIHYDPMNLIYYFPVSFCYILSMTLSYFGMRFIEESISDPIENTSGGIVFLLCILLLAEKVSWISVLAVIAEMIGVIGVGFLDNHGATDRKKKIGKKMAIIAFAMPFCYAILDATGTFMDDIVLEMSTTTLTHVNENTIELVANTSYELTFLIVAVILMIFMWCKGVKYNLPKQGDKILAAVCETAGQFTYVFAMSGNGAIAAPIMDSVVVVSLLLSRVVLKERLTKRQYFFIFMIVAGIITLAITEA